MAQQLSRFPRADRIPASQETAHSPVTAPEIAASSAPKPPRPRSASQPAAKTVQFDLGSNHSRSSPRDLSPQRDPGYETDDSDSSIGSHDRPCDHHRRRHHRRRHRPPPAPRHVPRKPRSSPGLSRPQQGPTSSRANTHHFDYKPIAPADEKADKQSSESDSTIDLPDRFDSEGDPMPEPRDDPLAKPFLTFLGVAGEYLLHEQDRVRSRQT